MSVLSDKLRNFFDIFMSPKKKRKDFINTFEKKK